MNRLLTAVAPRRGRGLLGSLATLSAPPSSTTCSTSSATSVPSRGASTFSSRRSGAWREEAVEADCVVLKGMSFFARHGVLAEEAALGQKFTVDLKLFCCLDEAGRTDEVEKTVDYAQVYRAVKGVVEGGRRYNLVEGLAHDIIRTVFDEFGQVEAIDVFVKKPQVALMGDLEYSGVQMLRCRT